MPPDQARPTDKEIASYADIARRTASSRGALPDEADLVGQVTAQKTIEKWPQIQKVKGDAGKENYVSRMARNVFTDEIRAHASRSERHRKAAGLYGEQIDKRPGVQHHHVPTNPSAIERFESDLVITGLIAELPTERQRQCLGLLVFGGLNMTEIGEQLGLSVQTVSHHIGLARGILINRLEGEDRGGLL